MTSDPTDRYPSAASATQRVPPGPGLLAAPGVAPALASASSRPSPIGRRRRSARRRSSSSGFSAASGAGGGGTVGTSRRPRPWCCAHSSSWIGSAPEPGCGSGTCTASRSRSRHDGRGMFRDWSTLSSWKIGVGSSPSVASARSPTGRSVRRSVRRSGTSLVDDGSAPGPAGIARSAPVPAPGRSSGEGSSHTHVLFPFSRHPPAAPSAPPDPRSSRTRHTSTSLILIPPPVAVAAERPNDVEHLLPQRQPLERTWGPDPAEHGHSPATRRRIPGRASSLECPGVREGVSVNGSRAPPVLRHCVRARKGTTIHLVRCVVTGATGYIGGRSPTSGGGGRRRALRRA